MTLEQLTSEVMGSQALSLERRGKLRNALAKYGIELDNMELFALSKNGYTEVLESLYKMAKGTVREKFDTFVKAVEEAGLNSLIEAFIRDFRAGKYTRDDIDKLYLIVAQKGATNLTSEDFHKGVINLLEDATVDSLLKETPKLNGLELEPIDAMVLSLYASKSRIETAANELLDFIVRYELAQEAIGAEQYIQGRLTKLKAHAFENDLVGEEETDPRLKHLVEATEATLPLIERLSKEEKVVDETVSAPRKVDASSQPKPAVSHPSKDKSIVEYNKKGIPKIGGWLILFTIGMVIGPLLSVVNLLQGWNEYQNVPPVIRGWTNLALCVDVGTTLIMLFMAFQFFILSKRFPKSYWFYAIFYFIGYGAVIFWYSQFYFISSKDLYDFVAEIQFIPSCITMAIWSLYLWRSKRVKQTFIN